MQLGKLRILSGKEVCDILSQHGFQEVRQRGSHIILLHTDPTSTDEYPPRGSLSEISQTSSCAVSSLMKASVIYSSPDILSGMPVFLETRVSIKNLFDYLESGDTIENFLNDFPTVKREQVIEVLEWAERVPTADASIA